MTNRKKSPQLHLSFRFHFALVFLACILLAACTPGALPTNTPTPGSGGMAPPVDPGSGGADTSTGLTVPAFAPPPSGSVAPPARGNVAHGTAVLVIQGELAITYTGGDCDVIADETYLTIYPGVNPGASLIIFPGTGSARQATLVWARSGLPEDNGAVSAEDPLSVTLNDDGFSGSFEGRGFQVGGSGGVATRISVSGTFTCVAQVLHVGGAHPVDLTGVVCTADPAFTVRSGGPGTDAALLMAEEGATAGSTVQAGLSWRVGGVSYTTNWLMLRVGADGVSGSYYGEATALDGTVFPVNGGFSCLG
jgi:hypothetical protein